MEETLTKASPAPLEGIRVLDLSHMLAAPLATMMLADLGASIVKVEAPPAGDHTRTVGAQGAMFLAANRTKRSIVVDLQTERGRDVALRLAAQSDIVVEAFRPGVLNKLGLGRDDLRSVNPSVILASLVGFGAVGPDSGRRGVDLVIQAESGIMSTTGEAGGAPLKVGFQLVDAASGLAFAQAILAALLRRERFGIPSEVEVRLLDTALYLQSFQLTEMSLTGVQHERTGNSAPHAAPSDLVHAADGDLVIAAYFDDQWRGLCEVLDLEWMLDDDRFATQPARLAHRAEMLATLDDRFRTAPRGHWYDRLNARGVLVGEVRTHDEILTWEQPRVNGAFLSSALDDGTPMTLVNSPYRLSEHEVEAGRPPGLGEHTLDVARELGFTDAEVDSMVADGVLGTPRP
jgi:crotonobetainyl-CoA:carnitine CoA-transferase CaiB-like acyl-CoA transferase